MGGLSITMRTVDIIPHRQPVEHFVQTKRPYQNSQPKCLDTFELNLTKPLLSLRPCQMPATPKTQLDAQDAALEHQLALAARHREIQNRDYFRSLLQAPSFYRNSFAGLPKKSVHFNF